MALSGINGELITKSWRMCKKAYERDYFRIEEEGGIVFFAFQPFFSVDKWFAHENNLSFGEIKMKRDQFPCMRSIGKDVYATVNQAFLNHLQLVISPRTSFAASVKKAVESRKRIVFTGHSSGGATAILATVWFLETNLRNDRPDPLCVTFGAPLVGDYIFKHALAREKWICFFFNFVNTLDIVPRIMLAQRVSIQQSTLPHPLSQLGRTGDSNDQTISEAYKTVMKDTSSVARKALHELNRNGETFLDTLTTFLELSPYRPAGTFVFCTGTRLVSVNNSEAILQILFYAFLSNNGLDLPNQDHLIDSYKEMGNNLSNHVSFVGQNSALDDLGLSTQAKERVHAALRAEDQRVENQKLIDSNWRKIEEKLEWIRTTYKDGQKDGYYDSFKASLEDIDFHANVTRAELAGMFDEVVDLLKKNQLPDEFEGSTEWIERAILYRRLTEPLDIANYYRHAKNEDTGPYMGRGRPSRYIYAHRGYEHDQFKKPGGKIAEVVFWSKVNALTLRSQPEMEKEVELWGSKCGSCFWAEVEELKAQPYEKAEVRIKILEGLLHGWIEEKEVDGEQILMEGSTYRKWWESLPEHHKLQSPVRSLIMR